MKSIKGSVSVRLGALGLCDVGESGINHVQVADFDQISNLVRNAVLW